MRIILRALACTTFVALLALTPLIGEGASFIALNGGAAASASVLLPQQPTQGRADKFDECGDVVISDWLARADGFAVELQHNPQAKGYIVAYGVPNNFPGWPARRAHHIRGYLIKGRGLDASRVEVVYGGYRDEVMYQLWIVQPGGQLPVPPFDFAAALAREKTPFLFDRFGWFPLNPAETDIEYGYIGFLEEKGRYETFVAALQSDPALRGCVIVYPTRRARRGTDKRLAARIKRTILTTNAVGVERVIALGGGIRHPYQTVELWLVPPGSPLPKPTATERPARRKGR